MYTRFFIISIILFLIIIVSEYVAYVSFHNAGIIRSNQTETILMILGIIFPVLFITSMLYGYKHYSIFNSWVNTISSIWLGIVLYIFIISLFIFILIILNRYSYFNFPIKIITHILLIGILILITSGIINANNPKIVKLNITSDQLAPNWKNKKIVIISDVHLGMTKRENFLKKIIEKIKNENPNVVFILGDLIDGPNFPYEKWLNSFNVLNPEFGILYVEGNHERYNQEYDIFKSKIPNIINNLTNKKIIINNTQILGLDYKENESPNEIIKDLEALEYDQNKSSILLIHDPKNVKYLPDQNISLILSGHTHGGQFFPFTLLLKGLYKKYNYGINQTNKSISLTSVGIGTAVIPFRIGTKPEIIVLNIE